MLEWGNRVLRATIFTATERLVDRNILMIFATITWEICSFASWLLTLTCVLVLLHPALFSNSMLPACYTRMPPGSSQQDPTLSHLQLYSAAFQHQQQQQQQPEQLPLLQFRMQVQAGGGGGGSSIACHQSVQFTHLGPIPVLHPSKTGRRQRTGES